MENDSKSGLRISEIILTLSAFIIMSTSTQLLVPNNKHIYLSDKTAKENIVNSKQRIALTSRSGIRRETNDEKNKYIKVEEIKISKDMDLTVSSGISKEDFKELLKNCKKDTSGFFYDNADIIYELCQKYELNEIFFCGLIAGESGWNIAKNHRDKCNYISMMSKGKLIKFNSPEEGLEKAAKLLHNKYLSEDGSYYSGKTLKNVQKIFCPNSSTWVDLVYSCMNQIIN